MFSLLLLDFTNDGYHLQKKSNKSNQKYTDIKYDNGHMV